jgi:hypothetical protein
VADRSLELDIPGERLGPRLELRELSGPDLGQGWGMLVTSFNRFVNRRDQPEAA